jgi:hypothetical protein
MDQETSDWLRGFLGLRFDEQAHKVRHVEQTLRSLGRHRGRRAERCVNLDEILDEVVQRHSRRVILDLPADDGGGGSDQTAMKTVALPNAGGTVTRSGNLTLFELQGDERDTGRVCEGTHYLSSARDQPDVAMVRLGVARSAAA